MQSLWMLFATFVFAIMGVCVKLASAYYPTAEIVLYRGLVGAIFIAALIVVRGGTLKTTLPWHHLGRGVIGVTALWLWFFSIGALPLPTAMTLNYMSPIWMAAILFVVGWQRGRNRFDWSLAAAIAASFGGVILLLRPSMQADQWFGGIIALISGIIAALAYLQVRQLGKLGEPEYRVVFYFSLTGALGGLCGLMISHRSAAAIWHVHKPAGIALLLAVGICATIAQMAMTRAYRLGNTLVTANLQYTGIVFSSIWSVLIWNDVLGWQSWAGIAVILGSGILTTFYNSRHTRATAALKAAEPDADPIAAEI